MLIPLKELTKDNRIYHSPIERLDSPGVIYTARMCSLTSVLHRMYALSYASKSLSVVVFSFEDFLKYNKRRFTDLA